MIKKGRGGFLQFSFSWLFAIIVGIVILILAIYTASKFMGIGGESNTLQASKQIEAWLQSFSLGVQSGFKTNLETRLDTRIESMCDSTEDFGEQGFRISQFSFNKWGDSKEITGTQNIYVFTESPSEGKNFVVFAKPLKIPFKVGDLVYLKSGSSQYCFADAPDDVRYEIEHLNNTNIFFDDCQDKKMKQVCFSNRGAGKCDMWVDYEAKSVEKEGGTVFFIDDSMMHAAIFSDRDTYECQVVRLMKRANSVAKIYEQKIALNEGCGGNLKDDLVIFEEQTSKIESSSQLSGLAEISDSLENKNSENRVCRLW